MSDDLLVLDADGVILDYHEGYALAWERAFGHRPQIRNPDGYHPRDYWDVPVLAGEELRHFWTVGFDEELWRSMPALPGAAEACRLLRDAGHRLVCVTALGPEFEAARTANLWRKQPLASVHQMVVRAPDGQARTFRFGTESADVPAQVAPSAC